MKKALSIKQPWASLIAHGIKDIENRTWKTHFRGRIYIHASAKDAGYLSTLLNDEQFTEAMERIPIIPKTYYSSIIGEVDIVDCVINHPSIWAEKTEVIGKTVDNEILYRGKPIYNWVLANPVLYNKPILNVKGKLSFWEPDEEIIATHKFTQLTKNDAVDSIEIGNKVRCKWQHDNNHGKGFEYLNEQCYLENCKCYDLKTTLK